MLFVFVLVVTSKQAVQARFVEKLRRYRRLLIMIQHEGIIIKTSFVNSVIFYFMSHTGRDAVCAIASHVPSNEKRSGTEVFVIANSCSCEPADAFFKFVSLRY
jgi:hypothetical protein